MRKNLKPKPYIYPLPVLIIGTYDENGVANAMNAAWGTVCDVNRVCIFVTASHKTTKNFLRNILKLPTNSEWQELWKITI